MEDEKLISFFINNFKTNFCDKFLINNVNTDRMFLKEIFNGLTFIKRKKIIHKISKK